MALKSTVFKAELSVADIDRGVYLDRSLTIARHPSETDERMMVRLLAFALHADERLAFGPGLSAEDEPDIVLRDLTGTLEQWIDVGLPDERDVRKASGRAKAVKVYTYGRGADIWWNQNRAALQRLANVSVIDLASEATQGLARFAERNMDLQCTVQEGTVWFTRGDDTLHPEPATR